MKRKFLPSLPALIGHNNDVSAWVPALWARESIAILVENMVMAGLVHRDFENTIANYGDTVNTRKPAEFTAKRKTNADEITVQNATATNVQVVLNQHIHVSFIIKDGERSKAFADLVTEYLEPAMIANARMVDRILMGQQVRFWAHAAGGLQQLSSSNAPDYMIDARTMMNKLKVPEDNRNVIWTTDAEGLALKNTIFLKANEVGDGGQALAEAVLGHKLGFNHIMSQNAPTVSTAIDTVSGSVNGSMGTVGATALTMDAYSGTIGVNSMFTVAGDYTPQRVVTVTAANTANGYTTSLTFTPGLRHAVADNALLTFGDPGAVNNASAITDGDETLCASGYPIGYAKPITVDGFTNPPQVGQAVIFGTATTADIYCIVDVNTAGTAITLDRPLVAAITNDEVVNLGPAGQYNFAFRRNAIAMVSRPLALPETAGVNSAVIDFKDISVRVTIGYDQYKQGHLVTVDLLFGVATLDTNQGGVLLG